VPAHVSSALSTLPALKEGEVVSAIDLANHYQQDRAAASIERCYDALGHLEQSMPVPLCISGLIDDLGKIARTGVAAINSPMLW